MDAAMYKYNAKKDKVKKLHSYQLGKASVMYYSKEKHQVVFVTGDTGREGNLTPMNIQMGN